MSNSNGLKHLPSLRYPARSNVCCTGGDVPSSGSVTAVLEARCLLSRWCVDTPSSDAEVSTVRLAVRHPEQYL